MPSVLRPWLLPLLLGTSKAHHPWDEMNRGELPDTGPPQHIAMHTRVVESKGDYTTYRLEMELTRSGETAYALAGTSEYPLVLPPAHQVATPFGADIGGVNEQLLGIWRDQNPDVPLDSWLSVGFAEVGDMLCPFPPSSSPW
jgi:hypothetical protein